LIQLSNGFFLVEHPSQFDLSDVWQNPKVVFFREPDPRSEGEGARESRNGIG
jgi:hypothetical protein